MIVATAQELFGKESAEKKLQYIVALNFDQVPYEDFSENFEGLFNQSVRITFSDATEDGGLLGIRF